MKRLVDILRDKDVLVNTPCGGNGKCGKCKVKVINGKLSELNEVEKKFLTTEEVENGIRLACQTMADDDVTIEILESKINSDKKKF